MDFYADYVRVTIGWPCPICGKPDWCAVARDGKTALCPRVVSETDLGEKGYLHLLEGTEVPPAQTPPPRLSPIALQKKVDGWKRRADHEDKLFEIAMILGVDAADLADMGVGWTGDSWSFPMKDAFGNTIGIRLRYPNGKKGAVRGSRQGVFYPYRKFLSTDTMWFPEGPSDTAALLGIGLFAVGRPNNLAGNNILLQMMNRYNQRRAVVVADNDPAGMRGALKLARLLQENNYPVFIIKPRACKDARECTRHGADRQDIMDIFNPQPNSVFWETIPCPSPSLLKPLQPS